MTYYRVGTNWHGRKSRLSDLKGETVRYKPSWTPDIPSVKPPQPKARTRKTAPKRKAVNFTEILRHAIDSSGKSVNTLSKETGIAQPVLARFYNGTRDNLRLDVAERLATHLGYTLTRG